MTERGATEPVAAPTSARRVRWRWVAAAVVAFGAVAWVLSQGLSDSLVYLQPVSDAVREREESGTRQVRIGGTVVPGTIQRREPSGVAFELTEGGVTIRVEHEGDPPDLFEDGAPVVVEGRWDGTTFASERLLIRHGNEYAPPTGGAAGAERAEGAGA